MPIAPAHRLVKTRLGKNQDTSRRLRTCGRSVGTFSVFISGNLPGESPRPFPDDSPTVREVSRESRNSQLDRQGESGDWVGELPDVLSRRRVPTPPTRISRNGLLISHAFNSDIIERRVQFGYTVFLTTILDSSILDTNDQPRSKYASNSRISISISSERPETSPREKSSFPYSLL